MPVRSASLFKVTVFLLAVPAVLLLALTILTVLVSLVSGQSGIGGFAFALTGWQVMIAIAMGLGAIILLFALALAFFRPSKRQKPGANR
jgi:membrane protein implicated in regulation of membrane protease activity